MASRRVTTSVRRDGRDSTGSGFQRINGHIVISCHLQEISVKYQLTKQQRQQHTKQQNIQTILFYHFFSPLIENVKKKKKHFNLFFEIKKNQQFLLVGG